MSCSDNNVFMIHKIPSLLSEDCKQSMIKQLHFVTEKAIKQQWRLESMKLERII